MRILPKCHEFSEMVGRNFQDFPHFRARRAAHGVFPSRDDDAAIDGKLDNDLCAGDVRMEMRRMMVKRMSDEQHADQALRTHVLQKVTEPRFDFNPKSEWSFGLPRL